MCATTVGQSDYTKDVVGKACPQVPLSATSNASHPTPHSYDLSLHMIHHFENHTKKHQNFLVRFSDESSASHFGKCEQLICFVVRM